MSDLPGLFADVRTIQLYDWPHPMVPGILLNAGFTVYGHAPDGYHRHEIVDEAEATGRSFEVFGRRLVAHGLDGQPDGVDLVCTFRPPEEQPEIVDLAANQGARVFWVQEPAEPSEEARVRAEAAGMVFVHGVGIEQVVREFAIEALA